MRSASADPTRRAARPNRAGGSLHSGRSTPGRSLLAVLTLALACLLAGCGGDVDIDPPRSSQDTRGELATRAQDTLDDLVAAVQDGARDEAVSLATPDAEDLLGQVVDNAAALRITGLALRYVDEGPELTAEEQAEAGPGAWRASVEVEYRYGGLDESPARVETSAVLVPGTDTVQISSVGGPEARTPLWLADSLAVVRSGRAVVAVAGAEPGRLGPMVTEAVRQVRRTLPDWDGTLVVEVPRSTDQLDAALQSQPGQYDNIAAVTTTADGSLSPGTPVRVVVNPVVFGKLEGRGAQVVMSHEATHVATGATFASMPTWLLEGFADFVALDDAGVPVQVAARQILQQVRKDGLPRGLPSTEDLAPSADGLGATYEEAWLACRSIAEQHGEDGLVRFYGKVSDGASAEEAFRSELGTTQQAFVARWRADLARLAGVAG